MLISLAVLVLVFLVGVKTEWISVSNATPAASDSTAREDRAYEAVVLGQTRPDATSGELIDAAVTRGEISSEQGLLYGVYLACGDPRLPAQFRGHDPQPAGKSILWEADVDWAALSPATQEALRAFFAEAHAGRACGDELQGSQETASVWWAPALQEQPPNLLAVSH